MPHGKNSFAEVSKNLDTENNYVKRLSVDDNAAKILTF